MKKFQPVVFFGTAKSVFVSRTQQALSERGMDVSIVDPYSAATVGSGTLVSKLWRMFQRFRFARRMMLLKPADSTAVVHSLSIDCVWLAPLLASHFRRVVGIAYGSDVLRRTKRYDPLLRLGLKKFDAIAATNENIIDTLASEFPILKYTPKILIRFGLPVFDELLKLEPMSQREAKEKLGYNPEKKLICLGYSASSGQRQIELLDFFGACAHQYEEYIFVVPVQYGSPEIIADVRQRCADLNVKYGHDQFLPLLEFHDPKKTAEMRLATDVLINHSVSDAFSGTVQETVYAGNLVLAGDHLPYHNMPGFGSAIKTFSNLQAASISLQSESLKEWRECVAPVTTQNRLKLHATSSWESVFFDWQRLITGAAD